MGNDTIELSGAGKYGSVSLHAEGGAGDDVIRARSQNLDYRPSVTIELYGGDGNDQLTAETIQGYFPNIYLYGGAGDDILSATDLNPYPISYAGRSEMYGGDGNDVLRGSRVVDMMHGGADADRFELSAGAQDTILDFNLAEGDRLALAQGTVTGTVVSGSGMVVSFTGGSVLLVGVTELDLSLAFA